MNGLKIYLANHKGITLIELLLSITLFTVVILTFMSFFTNAFRYNSISSDNIQAMNIAREYQARIKEADSGIYELLGTPPNPSTAITNLHLITPVNPDGTPYIPEDESHTHYILNIPDPNYTVTVTINKTPEAITGSYNSLNLVYVAVKDKKGKLLSETYTYYEMKR